MVTFLVNGKTQLKGHAPKRVAVKRAVFDSVKRVLFYTTIEKYAVDFSLRR